MRKDLLAGAVIEVMLGAGEASHGVRRLWKALRHETPTAAETLERKMIDPEGPPLAQVFRTEYAGHTGKLSHARIWRGEIKDGATLGGTRLGGIYHFVNGELSKSPVASPATSWRLGRLDGVATGATISPGTTPEQLPFPPAPTPVYALAVTTADRKDDVRLSDALAQTGRGRSVADRDAGSRNRRNGDARPGRDASAERHRAHGEKLQPEDDHAPSVDRIPRNDPRLGA